MWALRSAQVLYPSRFARLGVQASGFHVCVVGSGPGAWYAAESLLKKDAVKVDMYERLPFPFGLVRFGVAPDHPEVKAVTQQFERVLAKNNPRLRFLGNVHVGTDVSVSSLRAKYDAVVLAYGAESDRMLGIEGEDLNGVYPAREFVRWYNGHPESRDLPVDLSKVKEVTVVGLGNVALDVARILLMPPDSLKDTDICRHALEELRGSTVERVHLVGRRGAPYAAWTAKELREILFKVDGINTVLSADDLVLSDEQKEYFKKQRAPSRMLQMLQKSLKEEPKEGARVLQLHFCKSPSRILPNPEDETAVGAIELVKNRLEGNVDSPRAIATEETENIPCQMVLVSIGYRSKPIPEVPFDEKKGLVPHERGRVVGDEGSGENLCPMYVTGWLKRGPSGIVGTNKWDAAETIETLISDVGEKINESSSNDPAGDILARLAKSGIKVVSFEDWKKIDELEMNRGKALGKPEEREKFVLVQDVLSLIEKE